MVKFFIEYGSKVSSRKYLGLKNAAEFGYIEILKYLLQNLDKKIPEWVLPNIKELYHQLFQKND